MNVDIIGDIHGDKLVGLLAHLDYREIAGVWRHPNPNWRFSKIGS